MRYDFLLRHGIITTIPLDHEIEYCREMFVDGCMYVIRGYDQQRFGIFVPYYKDCIVVFFDRREHEVDCCELSVFDYKTFVENELSMLERIELDKQTKFVTKSQLENQMSLVQILCDITQAQIMKNKQILEAKFKQQLL